MNIFRCITRFLMAMAASFYTLGSFVYLIAGGEHHLAIWWGNLLLACIVTISLWDCWGEALDKTGDYNDE